MDSKRVRVVVSGQVQGVFFRASTRSLAERLGLTGWVRNVPGSKVEAEFQGPPDALEQAVAFCHEGPEHAIVKDVEVHDAEPVPGEGGFRVR